MLKKLYRIFKLFFDRNDDYKNYCKYDRGYINYKKI